METKNTVITATKSAKMFYSQKHGNPVKKTVVSEVKKAVAFEELYVEKCSNKGSNRSDVKLSKHKGKPLNVRVTKRKCDEYYNNERTKYKASIDKVTGGLLKELPVSDNKNGGNIEVCSQSIDVSKQPVQSFSSTLKSCAENNPLSCNVINSVKKSDIKHTKNIYYHDNIFWTTNLYKTKKQSSSAQKEETAKIGSKDNGVKDVFSSVSNTIHSNCSSSSTAVSSTSLTYTNSSKGNVNNILSNMENVTANIRLLDSKRTEKTAVDDIESNMLQRGSGDYVDLNDSPCNVGGKNTSLSVHPCMNAVSLSENVNNLSPVLFGDSQESVKMSSPELFPEAIIKPKTCDPTHENDSSDSDCIDDLPLSYVQKLKQGDSPIVAENDDLPLSCIQKLKKQESSKVKEVDDLPLSYIQKLTRRESPEVKYEDTTHTATSCKTLGSDSPIVCHGQLSPAESGSIIPPFSCTAPPLLVDDQQSPKELEQKTSSVTNSCPSTPKWVNEQYNKSICDSGAVSRCKNPVSTCENKSEFLQTSPTPYKSTPVQLTLQKDEDIKLPDISSPISHSIGGTDCSPIRIKTSILSTSNDLPEDPIEDDVKLLDCSLNLSFSSGANTSIEDISLHEKDNKDTSVGKSTYKKKSPGQANSIMNYFKVVESSKKTKSLDKKEEADVVIIEKKKKTVSTCDMNALFNLPISPRLQQTKPKGKNVVMKMKKQSKASKMEQMYIDIGQKDFGHTKCPVCGMIYTKSQEDDETQHAKFHQKVIEKLHIKGWKSERVVQEFPDGRVILILSDDHPCHLKKLSEVREIVDAELGFVTAQNVHPKAEQQAFLFLMARKIVGCAIAVSINKAYPVIPTEAQVSGGQSNSPASSWCCSTEPVSALCGISRVWVFSHNRRRKIATRLVDCVRYNFLYGCVIPKEKVAFSDPTPNGRSFAEKYVGKRAVLVFR